MILLDYLKKAQKEKWAIGQFNFSTDEQLKGIIVAAKKMNSPVIIGTSEGESNFLGMEEIAALVRAFQKKAGIPVFLNLDHGRNLDYIRKAIEVGYDCVHFDGSSLALSENIQLTKEVVRLASPKSVLVEGEVGIIGGRGTESVLTDAETAERFVKETGVDSLAVAIGNVHGVFSKMPELDFDRLKDIEKRTKVFLVLHGGSGIDKKDIEKAIKLGIVKININTELRIQWKESLEDSLKKETVKPYEILSKVVDQISGLVEEKIQVFQSNNKV